jgi:hypothetical protein
MGKVFGIGLGRTGSMSLARAMRILGYKSIHSIKDFNCIKKHTFCGDIEISGRYKFLDYAYKDAKFILTIRDLESWLDSNRRWAANRKGEPWGLKGFTGISIWRALNRWNLYEIAHYDEDTYIRAYYRHHAGVYDHFAERKDKLLTLNVCGGDGWEVLCPFLGIEKIPDVRFPHTHRGPK